MVSTRAVPHGVVSTRAVLTSVGVTRAVLTSVGVTRAVHHGVVVRAVHHGVVVRAVHRGVLPGWDIPEVRSVTRVGYPCGVPLSGICLPVHTELYTLLGIPRPLHCRSPYYTPGVLLGVHGDTLLGSVLPAQHG